MTETLASTFNQETFETFLDSRREPGWLVDQRSAAWKAFCEMEWPDRRSEEWLRTDTRLFRLDKYSLPLPEEIAPLSPLRGEGSEFLCRPRHWRKASSLAGRSRP